MNKSSLNGGRISAGQMMLLFLLARVMHAMIYRTESFGSGTPMMIALLCATAVEAVAAIPAVYYFSAGGRDPAADLLGRYSPALRLCYSAYFAVIAGGTVAFFAGFIKNEFSEILRPAVVIILLIAAAAYCACLGIEGLARAGTVVFWMFALLFVVMAAVSEGGFEWLNIRPPLPSDSGQFWHYFIDNLSSAWWLPMLCALGSHLKKGAAAAAFGYLGSKLLIIGALLLLVTLVLWRYVDVLGYPIFALGAYAKTDFIQRFDAINMLVWAINCVIVISVYIFICSKASKRQRPAAVGFALAAGVLAAVGCKIRLRFDENWFLIFKLAGVAILGVAVPAAAEIKRLIGRFKDEKAPSYSGRSGSGADERV